jgi:hypothetical protein
MSKFYILDTRTIVGNEALWWRPDSAGYTTNLDEAGQYTEEQTKGLRPTDIPVPVEKAQKLAHRSVNADLLATHGYKKPKEKRAPQHCSVCKKFIPSSFDLVCAICDT